MDRVFHKLKQHKKSVTASKMLPESEISYLVKFYISINHVYRTHFLISFISHHQLFNAISLDAVHITLFGIRPQFLHLSKDKTSSDQPCIRKEGSCWEHGLAITSYELPLFTSHIRKQSTDCDTYFKVSLFNLSFFFLINLIY